MSSTSLLDELELTQHFQAIVATGKLESVQDDDPLRPPPYIPYLTTGCHPGAGVLSQLLSSSLQILMSELIPPLQ
jgi:hypothetical protein